MTEHVCPNCNQQQFSINDQEYLKLFGHCWREDCEAWRAGKLALDTFEERENQAAAAAAKVLP